jgi:hypothetical protein
MCSRGGGEERGVKEERGDYDAAVAIQKVRSFVTNNSNSNDIKHDNQLDIYHHQTPFHSDQSGVSPLTPLR